MTMRRLEAISVAVTPWIIAYGIEQHHTFLTGAAIFCLASALWQPK
jgi:hypothetical protein